MIKINPSEITPEHLYVSRREFMAGVSAVAASLLFLGSCGGGRDSSGPVTTDEMDDELTPFDSILSYNNFYEFTTSKEGIGRMAKDFKTSPWTIEVGGLVRNL